MFKTIKIDWKYASVWIMYILFVCAWYYLPGLSGDVAAGITVGISLACVECKERNDFKFNIFWKVLYAVFIIMPIAMIFIKPAFRFAELHMKLVSILVLFLSIVPGVRIVWFILGKPEKKNELD